MRKKRGGPTDSASVLADLVAEAQESLNANQRAIAQLDKDILEAEKGKADLSGSGLPRAAAERHAPSPDDYKDLTDDILAAVGHTPEAIPILRQQFSCLQNARRLELQTLAEAEAAIKAPPAGAAAAGAVHVPDDGATQHSSINSGSFSADQLRNVFLAKDGASRQLLLEQFAIARQTHENDPSARRPGPYS